MDDVLLQTKLFAPRLRGTHVPRGRLIDRLNSGLDKRLTLVSAPAGFGKTTLVINWLSQAGRPFSWISLDEGDNDPLVFFRYVGAAVQSVQGVGVTLKRMLQAQQPPPARTLAAAFVNDCAAADEHFILALDDFHLISALEVHRELARVLDNMPPQIHLVITSRIDPLLPLPRLRARGQMNELRTDDLRFTSQETAAFLKQVMGVALTGQQIGALEGRIEGWVAGYQMAALSMQGIAQPTRIAAFVREFTASHRYIFDFLTDEVLQHRPPDTQAFMLKTSLLDRFNAGLCNAVTGQPGSQAVLERLENANLFLFPLDANRMWYRYHHLFQDLLKLRLRRSHPEWEVEIYQKASRWFGERDEVETAVHYALAGKDISGAARLLDGAAFGLLRQSEILKLNKLLDKLPFEVRFEFPRLCITGGWVKMFTGEYALVEKYLSRAEVFFADPRTLPDDLPPALGRANVETVRSYTGFRLGRVQEALDHALEALDHLESVPDNLALSLQSSVNIILGQIHVTIGAVEDAGQYYLRAQTASKLTGRFFGVMASYSNSMILDRRRGRLDAAITTSREAFAWLREYSKSDGNEYPAEGEIHRELGRIYYEKNQLETARKHIARAVELNRYTSPEMYMVGLHLLFRVALAQGDIDQALEIHEKIEPYFSELAESPFRKQAAAKAERLWRFNKLAPNNLDWMEGMRQWIAGGGGPDIESLETSILHEKFAYPNVLAAAGQPEEALQIFHRFANSARQSGLQGDLARFLARMSVILKNLSRDREAQETLSEAIVLGEKAGFMRTFLDEGEEMLALLQTVPPSAYVEELLLELRGGIRAGPKEKVGTAAGANPLVETLSDREMEILRLLTSHLSGPEIAGHLHISLNTFKTHTKNIYSKLGANSRSGAVVAAQQAGLIPK